MSKRKNGADDSDSGSGGEDKMSPTIQHYSREMTDLIFALLGESAQLSM